MITLNEIKRRLENIVQLGTISETKSAKGKALARVVLDDDGEDRRVSAFLPVFSIANSFMRVWMPLRVGEQVTVISPFGNANVGFIIRSIFNRGCKEPSGANDHTAAMEFEDGTIISYDSVAHELKIIAKRVKIVADTVDISADVSIDGELSVSGNIASESEISDVLGDLTNHQHAVVAHSVAVPR